MSINKLLGAAAVYGLTACGGMDIKNLSPEGLNCNGGAAFAAFVEAGMKATTVALECNPIPDDRIEIYRRYIRNSSGVELQPGEILCRQGRGIYFIDHQKLADAVFAGDLCERLKTKFKDESKESKEPRFIGKITIYNDDQTLISFPGIVIKQASCDNPEVKLEVVNETARTFDVEESGDGRAQSFSRTAPATTNLLKIDTSANDYLTGKVTLKVDLEGREQDITFDLDKSTIYMAP